MRIGQILVRVISSRIVKEIRLFVVTLRRNDGGSLKMLAEHVCLQGIRATIKQLSDEAKYDTNSNADLECYFSYHTKAGSNTCLSEFLRER